MFCARGTTGADTCLGDSGGPIAYRMGSAGQLDNPSAWRLVGVTSWGTGCGNAEFPGVYARLGDRRCARSPRTRIRCGRPSASPRRPCPRPRRSATSSPARPARGPATTSSSPTSSTAGKADGSTRGRPVLGVEHLHGRRGGHLGALVRPARPQRRRHRLGLLRHRPRSTPASVPTTQIPSPETPRVPRRPRRRRRSASRARRARPTASRRGVSRVTARCAGRRCTVSLRVTDPAPSSGVRRVTGTVTWKRSCRKHGRRTTCAKTARVTGRKGSGTTWTLRLPRLPRGSASVAVVAVDGSGRHRDGPEADLQGSLAARTLIVPNAGSLAPCRRAPVATSSRR